MPREGIPGCGRSVQAGPGRAGGVKPGLASVIRAEQALLGAVLSDPAGQAEVLDLVDSGDMTRPYHGQVLAAMKRLRARGAAPWPQQVREEIRKDPDLPASVSRDGALLIDLMQASPHSQHAPAYAAMVISGSIRQRVALAAGRIRQATGGEDPEVVQRLVADARYELDRCRARWQSLPEQMRRELPHPAPERQGYAAAARRMNGIRDEIRLLRQDIDAGARDGLEERLVALAHHVASATAASAREHVRPSDAQAPQQARPHNRAAQVAGVRALRDLIADPSQVSAVHAWLQPVHFSHPGHGQLYAVMRDMHAVGVPIDPVTVSWEATRRGMRVDAAELTGGTGPFAVASASEVYRRGRLAQAVTAGQQIQAQAGDPGSSVRQLMSAVDERLHQLEPGSGPQEQRAAGPGTARHSPGAAATSQVSAAPEHAPEAAP